MGNWADGMSCWKTPWPRSWTKAGMGAHFLCGRPELDAGRCSRGCQRGINLRCQRCIGAAGMAAGQDQRLWWPQGQLARLSELSGHDGLRQGGDAGSRN
jgi:hypothetical protein